ncbi:MAG: 3-isopropylmalate dehydratase small subunit, partial [Deltaproteobacteria bacterium]|nr:3-isopropylmalate dehydratase small subunit [Deltaproteobacteria bacterium]
CVIAPGYSDIFYNNALKNGLLPAVVSAEAAEVLLKELQGGLGARLRVDLAGQTITSPSGIAIPFDIPPEAKRRLLEGLDDISLTLLHESEITAFEERRKSVRPWL